ncbi:permease-like cell division protein FtsX [Chromohalobacter sp. 296-RDG]|uniref:permease-like cell division protein FtsX n=1 Tax=Chromohalobacter sp. 296-RDG TaxID=2994062 RepID=UPI0024686587|nr:permease-like cell division protein FtsX [Chromohalobacter sp. 296-RDG]
MTRRTTSPESQRSTRRGARASQVGLESRTRAWLRHHRAMWLDSAQRLAKRPLSSLLTMLAIAIALVLPSGLWLALDSARLLDAELDESATVTVYLDTRLDERAAMDVAARLRDRAPVAGARLVTAAEGLAEFQQGVGLEDALASLEDNPLPAAVVVTPADTDPDSVRVLASNLEAVDGVDEARVDLAWLERLRRLAELGQRLTLALAGLFGLGVLLVVGNTIRLAVESRRQEIEVVTLIGATHAFVRRPFLYSGAWYGLGGGVLAIVLLVLGGHWLSAPVTALAESYGAHFTLPRLGFGGSVLLCVCSTILGWLGAWLAVGRHLADIKPR